MCRVFYTLSTLRFVRSCVIMMFTFLFVPELNHGVVINGDFLQNCFLYTSLSSRYSFAMFKYSVEILKGFLFFI